MGNTASGSKWDPNDIETWELSTVKKIHDLYVNKSFDFGLKKQDFTLLITSCVEGATDVIDEVWNIFDPKQIGIIMVFEALAALCAVSQGDFKEKVVFLFSCFDFNRSGDISYDEMVILMASAVTGMLRMKKYEKLPDDTEMETLTDEAFLSADADCNGTITKDEFVKWVDQLSQGFPAPSMETLLAKLGYDELDAAVNMELETMEAGDQSSMPSNLVSDGAEEGFNVTTNVEGVGTVSIRHDQKMQTILYQVDGLNGVQMSDQGFSGAKYIRSLATLCAKRLIVEKTKGSKTPKKNGQQRRKDTQTLVLAPTFSSNDDQADFLQLLVADQYAKVKHLLRRKKQLEVRLAKAITAKQ